VGRDSYIARLGIVVIFAVFFQLGGAQLFGPLAARWSGLCALVLWAVVVYGVVNVLRGARWFR
jgi:hypothetical protein